jgi:hypothetical protein
MNFYFRRHATLQTPAAYTGSISNTRLPSQAGSTIKNSIAGHRLGFEFWSRFLSLQDAPHEPSA